MPVINVNSVRVGDIVEYKGDIYKVLDAQHVKPGKGGAFMQLEMKGVVSGTKLNERIRTEETIEKIRIEVKTCQMLYKNHDSLELMDMETYEQFSVENDAVGTQLPFLQDEMMVTLEYLNSRIISVKAPDTVVLTVAETEGFVKGQTAAPSYKPAIMDNGIRVMVPPFINVGDKLVVKTEDSSYVERAK